MAVDVQALYSQFGPMVLRRCRKLLGDEDQALDAMHDVFVLLLRNDARLDGAAPASLLLRMATNVCLNRIRGAGRRPEDSGDDVLAQIACADDAESRSLARSLLAKVFGRELDSTRAIAVMHLVDGMTLEEVAREVGLSVSGVRKRLRSLKANVAALQEV